ncbi:MAG: 50S ribosomal protein L20 [Candidatus Omnitrophica bacterium]|nr:50S ribosomal protein L20 [Candidatus Omnitrophota bacterium]MCM8769049.1 50S ribosomal protein L20 [Candidatus Omnitrophota bacterium]
MPRVKHAPASRARHKKVLKRAKGYRQGRSKLFKRAKEFSERALTYAWRDRRRKKRDFRRLWIARLTAACRGQGISYSAFMAGVKRAGWAINRRSLAEIAFQEPEIFSRLVEKVRSQ